MSEKKHPFTLLSYIWMAAFVVTAISLHYDVIHGASTGTLVLDVIALIIAAILVVAYMRRFQDTKDKP